MASVNLTGTLTNPEGEPDEGAIVKFTLLTTTGTTVSSSKSQLEVPQDGLYDIDIVYGNLRVDYINEDGSTRFVAIVTVNGDTVATSLPELLNAAVPPTDAQLLEFQGILADAVTAQVAAEAAEAGAVAAEATLLAEKLTTVELIALSNTFAVGSVIDTLGYTSNGDGGGARWVKSGISGSTPSQSPAQKGGAVLSDGSGDVWALVGSEIDALSIGYIGDGVADEYLALIAGGADGRNLVIPSNTICNLSVNAAMSPTTKIIVENNVTFTGAGQITGLGFADWSLASKTNGWTATLDSNIVSTMGDFISFRKQGVPAAASESDALLVIATNDMNSASFYADIVGVGARAYIPSSNSNGRGWGLNAYARIAAGGDGLIHGVEVNLENHGTDNSIPDSPLAKYGLNITTKPGSNPGTAAIKIASSSDFHYGMWAAQSTFVSATSSYIALDNLMNLDAQGRLALGTETHDEQLNVTKSSGRSQVSIASDGSGGESSVKFVDTGTRNWCLGHWFDTGRLAISTAANLSGSKIFDIDANGSFGFNGFQSGSGQGGLYIANAAVAPTVTPTGGGILYVEGGALKFIGSSGTITTIAVP
tara:strand:+ start:2445 stop:4220 length:1776 start_codon:yes stop_codon:yes gene_type:complete